ncbi:hypothetical protein BHYA_0060g00370 [Botrytis hyacinthi]|uniref:Uncharacterized protein n=1 Tax=Botrytis hyacinthi TaxID=278943 RepID=A0A4Z1GQD8_9HELO|nr:hypothetical protein BHYA_0060g00370 [Botrytis hyacinthi]
MSNQQAITQATAIHSPPEANYVEETKTITVVFNTDRDWVQGPEDPIIKQISQYSLNIRRMIFIIEFPKTTDPLRLPQITERIGLIVAAINLADLQNPKNGVEMTEVSVHLREYKIKQLNCVVPLEDLCMGYTLRISVNRGPYLDKFNTKLGVQLAKQFEKFTLSGLSDSVAMAQSQQANNPAAFIPIHPELEYSGTFPNGTSVITFSRDGGDEIFELIQRHTLKTYKVFFNIDFTQPNNLTPTERAKIGRRIIKIRDAINYVAPGAPITSNRIRAVELLINMNQFSTWRLKSCAGIAELRPVWRLRWQINGGAPRHCYTSELDVVVDFEQTINDYAHRKDLPNEC